MSDTTRNVSGDAFPVGRRSRWGSDKVFLGTMPACEDVTLVRLYSS